VLPIVAHRAAAVPETLGAAGLLLPQKHPALVAAAVNRVVEDEKLRAALIRAGRTRLEQLGLDRSRARFAAVLEEAVRDATPG
jgi:glycosyltransferase involved in cell wall biosynthesis